MEQPPFIKHLPSIAKMSTSLGVRKKRLNESIFFMRCLLHTFFIFSTISCTLESFESNEESITKLHDLVLLLIFFSDDIFVFKNKVKVSYLIELITEPIQIVKENKKTVHSKIIKDHNKEVNLYCKLFTVFFTVVSVSWHLFSLVRTIRQFTSNNRDDKCIQVSAGWIRNSEYHLYFIFLNSVCLFMTLVDFVLWYFVMLLMVIRIKYKTRLLCASLDEITGFMSQSEECLLSNSSSVPQCTKPSSSVNIPSDDGARIRQIIAEQIQKELRDSRIKRQIAVHFEDLVDQHLSIIEHVKLTDQNFRYSIMFCIEFGIIVVPLSAPTITLDEVSLTHEKFYRMFEIVGMMIGIGFFNFMGQIVLDESEKLRQALYNCDWTDKPHSLRRGLLIMQTVATKPLQLTLGGIYTLSMETYTKVLGACHSYLSVIQSLEVNQH